MRWHTLAVYHTAECPKRVVNQRGASIDPHTPRSHLPPSTRITANSFRVTERAWRLVSAVLAVLLVRGVVHQLGNVGVADVLQLDQPRV